MRNGIPQIAQYQGSKRLLAPKILELMPKHFSRIIEPFSGMAAISVATAQAGYTQQFLINDLNEPLINMLKSAVETPAALIAEYKSVWDDQFSFAGGHLEHYYIVREQFNAGEKTAANMLYLLARCVKGAVRYGRDGRFNQSPDKRRHGTKPTTLEQNVRDVSMLLANKTYFCSVDYREILDQARQGDLVYMDPPYQGVSNVRDSRYLAGVDFNEFARAIETLDRRGIDYLISYDGVCGERSYGSDLPDHLRCRKILLNAGLSAQSTLLGKRDVTYEALYISDALFPRLEQAKTTVQPHKQLELLARAV